MSDTLENLRNKIEGARELGSVVRTMKAVAASSIGQYETAVGALSDYYRTVELGLNACYRQGASPAGNRSAMAGQRQIDAVVFGSDQGLIGQFNEVLADYVSATLSADPGPKTVWAVGQRIYSSLESAGLKPAGLFVVPSSVAAITPLVGEVLMASQEHLRGRPFESLLVFHNRPVRSAIYEPFCRRLLPLDRSWRQQIARDPWPTGNLPELIGYVEPALIREYLFISLFQACAESLASENASRLAAMQRAEKNIADLLEDLTRSFNRQRQSSIDEELFDVVSGFEALV